MQYYEIDFYNFTIKGYMSGSSRIGKFKTKNQARRYLKDNRFKMIDKDHYTSTQGGTQATIYKVGGVQALLHYMADV